jgi:hypothetical protein
MNEENPNNKNSEPIAMQRKNIFILRISFNVLTRPDFNISIRDNMRITIKNKIKDTNVL